MLGASPQNKNPGCPAYPRKQTVVYPDGTSDVGNVATIALTNLESASFYIPIGTWALKPFHVKTASARCEGVHWGAPAGGDSVIVTRISANTWHVTTQPAPKDSAVCKNTVNGRIVGTPLGEMPVDLQIVSSRDLRY